MKTVENGNAVQLHYKGTFPDGEVFDDSRQYGDPMAIKVGAGALLKKFESALVGMSEGEVKNIELTSEEAYGEPLIEAIVQVPRDAFPPDFEFEKDMLVAGRGPMGEPVRARVLEFDEETALLDHNHPLAGKDINFEIELVKIDETNETEE